MLAEKKIDCEMEPVDVAPVDNPVNRQPARQDPTLVLDDGTALYDSRVIAEFLDGKSPISRLIPDDLRDRVAVRRLEALADGVLDAGFSCATSRCAPRTSAVRPGPTSSSRG